MMGYDGPLLTSFLFPTMPRFLVTTCPTGSYLKSDTWQLQLRFVVPISKCRYLISACTLFEI